LTGVYRVDHDVEPNAVLRRNGDDLTELGERCLVALTEIRRADVAKRCSEERRLADHRGAPVAALALDLRLVVGLLAHAGAQVDRDRVALVPERPPAVGARRPGKQYERQAPPHPSAFGEPARLVRKHHRVGDTLLRVERRLEHRQIYREQHLPEPAGRERFEEIAAHQTEARPANGQIVRGPFREPRVPGVIGALGARVPEDDGRGPDAAHGERLSKQRPMIEPQGELVDSGDPRYVEVTVGIDDDVEGREDEGERQRE
jgi:hypothetical protein